jgi:chromodomain-helicase-DNA-binding protein 4/chromodomain-helicase-DNA-binding protein 5
LKEGESSVKDNEVQKKKPLIVHLKRRPTKELSAITKPLKSELLGKSSEEKQEKHGGALKIKKNMRSMDLSPKKYKSKRQHSHRDSKRSETKRLKYLAPDVDSDSSMGPSTSPDHSESPPKRRSADGRTPTSSAKKGKKKVKFVDKQHSEVFEQHYVLF